MTGHCAAGTPILAAASPDAPCVGRLEVPEEAIAGPSRLVTGSCRPHVIATYVHEDDGWYVDEVTVRPEGVLPEEEERARARERAIRDLRLQELTRGLLEAEDNDGVGGE